MVIANNPMHHESNKVEAIELIQSFIKHGITLGIRGLNNDAIEAFERAIAICRAFSGNSAAVRFHEAQALSNKGAAWRDSDRHEEAVKCYDTAIALYRGLEGEIADEVLLSNYAITVMNKGWSFINLDHDKEGFRYLEEALSLRRQLVAKGYDDVLPDVARSLYHVGEGYFRTEYFAKALKAFDEAMVILRRLLAEERQECEEDLAYTLAARADTLQKLNRLKEALKANDEAVELLKQVSGKTENPKIASALATTLDGRKQIEQKLRELKPTKRN